MKSSEELQNRLNELRREFRAVRSILEMMEKGTPRKVLEQMRAEKLKPIELEIQRVEAELAQSTESSVSSTDS